MKIYSDDPLVSYKKTSINPEQTKNQISAKLGQYGVHDILWHWKPDEFDVFVQFIIEENVDGLPMRVMAKVPCPFIWDKAKSRSLKAEKRVDNINLKISMRAMYWYIKTHLESAYAMQSSKIAGFLSDVVTPNGTTYFDEIKGRIDRYGALEAPKNVPRRNVVDITPEE